MKLEIKNHIYNEVGNAQPQVETNFTAINMYIVARCTSLFVHKTIMKNQQNASKKQNLLDITIELFWSFFKYFGCFLGLFDATKQCVHKKSIR